MSYIYSFKVHFRALMFICLILKTNVAMATTMSGTVVERPLVMECPEEQSGMNSLHEGIGQLTSNSPFAKKENPTLNIFKVIEMLRKQAPGSHLRRQASEPVTKHGKTSFISQTRLLNNSHPHSRSEPQGVSKSDEIFKKEHGHHDTSAQRNDSSYAIQPIKTNSNVSMTGRGRGRGRESVHVRRKRPNKPVDTSTSGNHFVRRIRPQRHFRRTAQAFSRDVALPWDCQAQSFWVDLGQHVLPRFVPDIRCIGDMCWYGHYYCKPIRMQMPVLVSHSGTCSDSRLPEDVQSRYMLSYVSVTTGCVCGRDE